MYRRRLRDILNVKFKQRTTSSISAYDERIYTDIIIGVEEYSRTRNPQKK